MSESAAGSRASAPIFAFMLIVVLHGGANLGAETWVRCFSEAPAHLQGRLSCVLHSLAWVAHTLALSQALSDAPGWRRLPRWQRIAEALCFLPLVVVPFDLLRSVGGEPSAARWSFAYFSALPDGYVQWSGLLLAFPLLTWLTLQRMLPTVRSELRWFFALSRGAAGAMLGAGAFVPLLVIAPQLPAVGAALLPGAIGVVLGTGWYLVHVAVAGAPPGTALAPQRPTRFAGSLGALLVILWSFWIPGVLWMLPGLRTVYALVWLSADAQLPAGDVAAAWFGGHIDVVAQLPAEDRVGPGYCAVWRCGADCRRYLRGDEVPGGNAFGPCEELPSPPAWRDCRGPVYARGNMSSFEPNETDMHLCGDVLVVVHSEYNGD